MMKQNQKIKKNGVWHDAYPVTRTEFVNRTDKQETAEQSLISLEADIAVSREAETNLRKRMEAQEGAGGALTAYDFGTRTPTQKQLTDYAMSLIPNISDATEIWNATHVVNLHDGGTWQLNNTQNTTPPIFEWVNIGSSFAAIATDLYAGVVKGGGDVTVGLDGKMTVPALNELKGEKGDKGDKGDPGERGFKGDKGEKGDLDRAYTEYRLGGIPKATPSNNPIRLNEFINGIYFADTKTPNFELFMVDELYELLKLGSNNRLLVELMGIGDGHVIYAIIWNNNFVYANCPTLSVNAQIPSLMGFKHWGWNPLDNIPGNYISTWDPNSRVTYINDSYRPWWEQYFAKTNDSFTTGEDVTVKEYVDRQTIVEAPIDGKTYGRCNKAWKEVTGGEGSGGDSCNCALKSDNVYIDNGHNQIQKFTYSYTEANPKDTIPETQLAEHFMNIALRALEATPLEYEQLMLIKNSNILRVDCLLNFDSAFDMSIEFWMSQRASRYELVQCRSVQGSTGILYGDYKVENGALSQAEVHNLGFILPSDSIPDALESDRLHTDDKTFIGAINEVYAKTQDAPSGGGGQSGAIKSDSLFASTYIEIEPYTLNFIYEYTGTDPKTLMTDEELALLLFKCNPLNSLDEFTYQDLVTMEATQFKYIKQEYISENDGEVISYESRINCLTSMNGDNIEFYINFIMDVYSGLNINKVLVVITTNGEIVEQEEVSLNNGVLISMDALITEEVYPLKTTDKTIVGAINELYDMIQAL